LIILLKGAGVLVGVLAILVAVGVIWFMLNPPFGSPETGKLHTSAARDLTVQAGQATLAIQLEARLNDNAMRSPNGQPGPPTLSAHLVPTPNGSVEGVRLLIAPGDVTSPSSSVRETAPGRLDWTMPCLDGPGRPCRQVVMLLVEAPPSATDRKLRLSVEGDLRYPNFVPTPGWSSFDLDLRSVGSQAGMGPNPVADAGGTVELAMGRPVVTVPVHVEYGAAPSSDAGPPPAMLRLALETVRLTETAPAGLDAPEPVRATVLAADGTVVGRLGVRPGEAPTLSVALDPCASGCGRDYRIAFEWMDRRPDADYRLTWRAEIIGMPADDRAAVSVAMRAGDPEVAEMAGTTLAPRSDAGPLRGQRLEVSIGGLPPVDVASSPVHVQLLVTASVDPAVAVGTDVVRIEPFAVEAAARSVDVPFDVVPGETGAIVVNLDDGCPASRCDRWALMSSIANPTGAVPSAQLDVTWQLEVRAWRLVPDAAPLTLSLDVR
jgi:hypothetical protein